MGSPLLSELAACRASLARRPALLAIARRAGLDPAVHFADGTLCGIDRVIVDGAFYQPDPEGEPALIAGAVDYGELIDLVATSVLPSGFGLRTRRGEAQLLGREVLEDSRFLGPPLKLYDSAWSWLREGRQGCVIVDWRRAPFQLEDVPALICESHALGLLVEQAFARPIPMPPLFAPPPQESAYA